MQQVRESTGTYFRVVVAARDGRPGPPRDITFQPVPRAEIPTAIAELQIEIEKTLTALNMLFPYVEGTPKQLRDRANNEKFDLYFEKLVGIAVLSLGQDQPVFGKLSLDNLQEEIRLRESGRVKNQYVRRLGIWAMSFIIPLAIVYLIARHGALFPEWIGKKREFVTLIAGSMLGTWLSFAIRKVELRFSELSIVENDQLDPPIRLLFVAGLTLVVGLIFSTKLATITIGGFDTHFLTTGTHALLIGLFCGIAEHSLAPTVGARASEFVGRISIGSQQNGGTAQRVPAGSPQTPSGSRSTPGDKHSESRADRDPVPPGDASASGKVAGGPEPRGATEPAIPVPSDDGSPAAKAAGKSGETRQKADAPVPQEEPVRTAGKREP